MISGQETSQLEAKPEPTKKAYAEDEVRWADLMRSAQSGDAASYRQLLVELSDLVERYLRSRLGSHEFLEDCVQEVLLAVHQARHTYDGRRDFRPWLFAIIRHKSTDALRRSEVRGRYFTTACSDPEFSVESPENELDSGRLLAQLPDGLRQAVTLTKIAGLSTAEAARQMNISESALKVRVHRAIDRMRRMMEADAL